MENVTEPVVETKPDVKPEEPKAETKPEEKKVSEKAEAKKAKEKALRAIEVNYANAQIATVLGQSPKKPGSKARAVWDLYRPGLSVADLVKAAADGGYAKACVIWDVRHGFITLEPVAKPEAKVEEPKAEEKPAA